jgi:hypothetical protein
VSLQADAVVRRRCNRCGVGESDLRAHLRLETKNGRILHLRGITVCGELADPSKDDES